MSAVPAIGLDSATSDALFRHLGVEEKDMVDLHGFENYVYGYGDKVIRVTSESHRDHFQLSGEIEFLSYLADHSAPVSKPIAFESGEFIDSFESFHICQFERARGIAAGDDPFDESAIRQWGRAIGLFHRLTMDFVPQCRRFNWREDDNHQFQLRIPGEQEKVMSEADALMARLLTLPTAQGTYGLIHCDAHAGNFLNEDGNLTFFDFDDCLYTWFGYDVATILVGVALQPWVGDSDSERVDAVVQFLEPFLAGYDTQFDRDCLMWDHMHDLLKLREFSLYGAIHALMDPENLDGWFPQKFMRGRRRRIEMQLPYVDIDFMSRF
jgi:Ser/Thr protein kinase RdoA (MazF antagonist)